MMGSKKTDFSFKRKLIGVAVISCFAGNGAQAAPTGAAVVRGNASITTSGSTMTVTNTPNAIINWASFGINSNETVRFVQQSAASSVLNRVTGADPSHILGALQSNGKVFLVNPNGIIFGQGARIDVNGLVASTLNMTDDDFLNGRLRFNADRAAPGGVSNAGEIRTPTGGFVYLLAPNVENSGLITTPSGEAVLAAGNSIELVDSVDPTQRVLVSAKSRDVNLSQLMTESDGNIFSVLNKGKVSANTVVQDKTGKIYFKSAGNIQTDAISVVEAHGDAAADGGRIQAFAYGNGRYQGLFDVSGKNGGFVETSGSTLDISGATVSARGIAGNAGTWLLDPFDYIIDFAQADQISQALSSGANVAISTASSTWSASVYGGASIGAGTGNITVNSAITKTDGSTTTLSFFADDSITINAPITNYNGASYDGILHFSMDAGNFATQTGNGITIAAPIHVNGNISVASYSSTSPIKLDATLTGPGVPAVLATGFYGVGGLMNINAYGGLVMQAGHNAVTPNNYALLFSSGDMEIVSRGDITLTGGYNTDGNSAQIISKGNQRIYFSSAGNDLTLQGGINPSPLASGGTNNHAQILAYGGTQIIQGNNCSDGCLGYEAGYNPNIKLFGGKTDPGATADNDNGAYIHLSAIGSVQTINAANIAMYGGGDAFSNAAISQSGGTSTLIIEKNATPFSPLTHSYGKLYMDGRTSGAIAAIGAESSDANIDIRAGDIALKNAMIGAAGFNGGLTSGTPNNATVNISAYGGGGILIQASGIGSEIGSYFGSLTAYAGNISIIDSMVGADAGSGGDAFLNIIAAQGDVVLNNAQIGADAGIASVYIATKGGGDIVGTNGTTVGSFSNTANVFLQAYGGNISLTDTGMGSSSGLATVQVYAYGGSVILNNAKLGTETGSGGIYDASMVRVGAGLAYGSVPFTSGQSISWSGTTGGIRAGNVTLDATGPIGSSSAPLLLNAATLNVNTHGSLAANNTNNNGVYLANAGLLSSALINAGNIELKQQGGFATNGGIVAHANTLTVSGDPIMTLDGFSIALDSANASLGNQDATLTVDAGILTLMNGASIAASGVGNIFVDVAAVGALEASNSTVSTTSAAGSARTQVSAGFLHLNGVSMGAYGGASAMTSLESVGGVGDVLIDQSNVYANAASGSADLHISGDDVTLLNNSAINAHGGASYADLVISATNLSLNNSSVTGFGASSSTLALAAANAMGLSNAALNLVGSGAFASLVMSSQSLGINTSTLTTSGMTNAQTALSATGGLAISGSNLTVNASSGNAQGLLSGNALTMTGGSLNVIGPGGATIDVTSGGNSSLSTTFIANSASGFSGFSFSGSGSTGISGTTLNAIGSGGASASFSSGGDMSVSGSSFTVSGGSVSGGFFMDSNGSLSLLSSSINASSSGDADADLFAGSSLNLNNVSITVSAGSGYGEGTLSGGTLSMTNTSLGVTGSTVAYALVDANGALTMDNSSISAGDIEFYGGSVLLQNGTSLSADIMDGHSKLDLSLNNSSLFAQDEMILTVGGQILLDNFSDITVVSPFTLFFDFPLLSSGGWVVDGVAGSFGSSSGSFIEVAGAAPIIDVNFFVTYGGTAITDPVVNLFIDQLLISYQPPPIIQSNLLANAPTSSDFFGTGDTAGGTTDATGTTYSSGTIGSGATSGEESSTGASGNAESGSPSSGGGDVFEIRNPEGEPIEEPQQCS